MDIVIFGASGATGLQLVKQALAKRHAVTAFVRSTSRITIRHERLTIVQGNVIDYPVVEQAIKGKAVVLSALGADNMFRYDRVVVDGMAHIIRAMESTGVHRLVYMSFIGVHESRKDAGFVISRIAPRLLRTEIAGHEARERLIRQSNLHWTIVQPPTLTSGALTQTYRIGEEIRSNAFAPKLSRADVADFMLKQLSDQGFIRKAVRMLP
jgi:putative NADH-flavin reductase